MNTASLELCKELYELSGWEGEEDVYRQAEPGEEDENVVCPAYSAGYLLRKLPKDETTYGFKLGKWYAQYQAAPVFADTPEDALCKLAIELFKQGVLKKERV